MTHWTNERATLRTADARSIPLASDSVHCIVTSPPYLGLRTYNLEPSIWPEAASRCDHHWQTQPKRGNLPPQEYCRRPACGAWLGTYGSEPSIEEYIDHTLLIFRELKRVLRPDGTLWLNVADSYNTSGVRVRRTPPGQTHVPKRTPEDPKHKDLLLMPARMSLALQQDGWYVRSEVIWDKTNCKPEAATDRPRKTHENVFILSKTPRYFYDHEAVKTPASPLTNAKRRDGRYEPTKGTDPSDRRSGTWLFTHQPETVNLRTVWSIGIDNRQDQHYAGFPEKLAETCILAATSERGACPKCGTQWTRTPTPQREPDDHQTTFIPQPADQGDDPPASWLPQCAHGATPVPSLVLDPFCGTGTTVAAAINLGRSALGTDASDHYIEMAKARISQLTVPMI